MIDVTRPVPCRKFASVPLETQMKKIHSEVGEAWEALNRNRGMFAEEITDVIVACTTMLDMIGYDEAARIEKMREVNEKNRVRGYWGDD